MVNARVCVAASPVSNVLLISERQQKQGIGIEKLGTKLETIKSFKSVTNPKSIHGIYPYRGKISAIEAASVVDYFPSTAKLLDPFCGSGTIVYEAKKHNLSMAWGTDLNPLAEWLTEAKLQCPVNLEAAQIEIDELLLTKTVSSKVRDEKLLFYFHEQTLREIESISDSFEEMSPYLKGCFAGAIALTARGCNGYQWTSSTVGKNLETKLYVPFFEKLAAKLKKHHYPIDGDGEYGFTSLDARNLSKQFKPGTFDIVFTSPPYFDALDYTAYYAKILYLILGVESQDVKPSLIQKASTYEEDMRTVLNEIVKVTSEDAKIIFVVGDKKTKNGVINGGDFFSQLLHHQPDRVFERSYTGSSSQIFDEINKTSRREQIVVWDKSKW